MAQVDERKEPPPLPLPVLPVLDGAQTRQIPSSQVLRDAVEQPATKLLLRISKTRGLWRALAEQYCGS